MVLAPAIFCQILIHCPNLNLDPLKIVSVWQNFLQSSIQTDSTHLYFIQNVLTQLFPIASPWVLKSIQTVISTALIGLWTTYDLCG